MTYLVLSFRTVSHTLLEGNNTPSSQEKTAVTGSLSSSHSMLLSRAHCKIELHRDNVGNQGFGKYSIFETSTAVLQYGLNAFLHQRYGTY